MSEHAHSSGARVYVLTLVALLILTGITVGASYINFGSASANIIIAIAIATVKVSLVALFFMHLRHDNPLNAIIFISSLIFLGIFLAFPLIDIQSREKVIPNGLRVREQVAAPKQAAPVPAAPAHH